MRVLVTASEGRLAGLEGLLEVRGYEAIRHPVIATEVIRDPVAAQRLLGLPWWLFLSRTAVEASVANGLSFPIDVRLAAVGPGTAEALRAAGGEVAATGDPATAEGLAKAVVRHPHGPRSGDSIGAVVGNRARSALRIALALHGVDLVTAELYCTRTRGWRDIGSVDVVVLASPSAVVELPIFIAWTALLVAIGPTTAGAIRRRGWEAIEATEPTVQGVLDALDSALSRRQT